MRSLIFIAAFIVLGFSAFAQKGKIEGKVTDSKTGLPLVGVSVIVSSTKQGTSTDLDGRYFLNIDASTGKISLIFSYNGITQQVDDIIIKDGKVAVQDIALTQRAKTEEGVVVRATTTAKRETAASLIAFQKNTNTVAQVISAEAIRRSPDKNTGEVLKRVPGISLQEGKYIIVRGLADRYNAAMLNGVLMSSTEPDRKTFSFDIIPSSLIDNIIVNKAFVPEYPGEWAGGLIQVNTKDVPSKDFFNIQIGTGFNTQTIGKDFYTYQGSKTDFLGFDNGQRALPSNLPNKSTFAALDQSQKTAYAKEFENIWGTKQNPATGASLFNQSFLINGGFNKKLGANTKLAAIFALNYNHSNKLVEFQNQVNSFSNNVASLSFDYNNKKYNEEVLEGALANITLQLGKNNKISFKNILNVNTSNYATLRSGVDYSASSNGENIRATELAFKANTFFNTQLSGEHNLSKYDAKFHWFGSFNILDQYIPDQRRLQYTQADINDPNSPYLAAIGSSNSSQKSGSRYYGFLNDYIYTAGGDLTKSFKINNTTQSVKGGYLFQVKDRLFDSRPFSIYLPSDNQALRALSPDQIFAADNFGNGSDNKFALNELSTSNYRYLANSILNAGFIQFDNQIGEKFRAVWGLRVEDFDQIIGSVRKSDPRFVNSKKTDYLPGLNLTYKLNNQTNFRLSASQTVIRPEFRELSTFQFYDFDLGATIAGNTGLVRTKISNFDLRYELYPRAGELFTLGVFYKYFKNPIEVYFNTQSGAGSSIYNFFNADEANSFGAELEFRKRLDFNPSLKNFTVQGNISYIYNRVTSTSTQLDRPMQGQSPYLFNGGLQYDVEKLGLSTTILFNEIGRRIAFVGGSDAPPIWENPRPVLDFQIGKKVLKTKGEVKLNVGDIFNKAAIFYNDLNDNKKYDKGVDAFAIKRKYGTNVSISFGYSF